MTVRDDHPYDRIAYCYVSLYAGIRSTIGETMLTVTVYSSAAPGPPRPFRITQLTADMYRIAPGAILTFEDLLAIQLFEGRAWLLCRKLDGLVACSEGTILIERIRSRR
jgi:hypothetical protein